MSSSLKTRQLKRSLEDEYELYKVALEWGLIDPIVIESKADLKSEAGWRDKVDPYEHQISNLISFCRRLPVTLLADDVGLGKTISAGLIISELMSRGRVSKILVVCPKLIIPQWQEELKVKFNIDSVQATGNSLLQAEPPNGKGAVITTYNSARLHLEKIVEKEFDFLILDEAHKLRNLYGTDTSPQVALKIKKVLNNRDFKYVLMLTATPIQNRLWDIFSLLDLLATARGHQNPFGTERMFARHYIADDKDRARQLRPEKREEFRSIVYSHMSRIRRGDARLIFPERVIQQHSVRPSEAEKSLFTIIAEPIQRLDKWSQMSVARALISSPHALAAELASRAKKGAISPDVVAKVRAIADSIEVTAKQKGLGILINQLRNENPTTWRMVVFTTRRETQTTIENYLTNMGILCGIINGDTVSRNQDTIARFKKEDPEIHVIISTEAGSEGVNLQAANVIVNYDLPWNPMIVEQRIGRVQRLNSKHGKVCIFNMILQGTFEEFVVGRLVEKLIMASHAIGDIDSLLSAAGIGEEDDDTFEERIRKLVIDSLTGKNVEQATLLEEQSILQAKIKLESEEQNIDELLGSNSRSEYKGPRSPKLSKQQHSWSLPTFVEKAVKSLGGSLVSLDGDKFLLELGGLSKEIILNNPQESISKLHSFGPGNPDFERLVRRISENGICSIQDLDEEINAKAEQLAKEWTKSFGGNYLRFRLDQVFPCFSGVAIVRARVTVAHDSYERLVEIACEPNFDSTLSKDAIQPLEQFIYNAEEIGVDAEFLIKKTKQEQNIFNFCKFYEDRLTHELNYAGDDDRAKRRLQDEFTPRIQAELVGFKGQYFRRLRTTIFYKLGNDETFATSVFIIPTKNESAVAIPMVACSLSKRNVPIECIGHCEITGQKVIKDLLGRSEFSGRLALKDKVVKCEISGKQLLLDEVQKSVISGKSAFISLLEKSDISGQYAEREHFARCYFTNALALKNELAISEVSQCLYRTDQQMKSALTQKAGHASEFILCAETHIPVMLTETDLCEVTGKRVISGALIQCSVTSKKVLKEVCITSSTTGKWLIKDAAKRSEITGNYAEPEFFGKCEITGTECLRSELILSEVSSKKFRADQQLKSSISDKIGHKSEFIFCSETNKPMIATEASKCELTGKIVAPEALSICAVTGKRVLPSQLFRCEVSQKKVIFQECVQSSISHALAIRSEAIPSINKKFCLPNEAIRCAWSGQLIHPDDIRTCKLTNLALSSSLIEGDNQYFSVLSKLLMGMKSRLEKVEYWDEIVILANRTLGNTKGTVESAEVSPDGKHIAVCLKISTLMGFKVRYAGLIYSINDKSLIGRITVGKRENGFWVSEHPKNNVA